MTTSYNGLVRNGGEEPQVNRSSVFFLLLSLVFLTPSIDLSSCPPAISNIFSTVSH